MNESILQTLRYAYKPKLPAVLTEPLASIKAEKRTPSCMPHDTDDIKKLFPRTYSESSVYFTQGKSSTDFQPLKAGVILSGGQAAGGHNVIAGLFDGLKKADRASVLIGFLGGPSGLIENKYIEITEDIVNKFRNTGGFDMIGSGRTKIETEEQINASIKTARELNLDAILIIGGDDSNTNAALLAEHFLNANLKTKVIGAPKTIDGDLKNSEIEISFGFDTATKTYSELIGNIARDANSSKKYWHFIKLMGRSASHIALECALKTMPNICLISEEVAAKKMTLESLTQSITEVIVKRADNGENFGIILIPEGLIEFIPEMQKLINSLNDLMSTKQNEFENLKNFEEQNSWLLENLSEENFSVFKTIPQEIAAQFLLDRDPHGNVQVSRIETEKLLIALTEKKLSQLKKEGIFKGKFSTYAHFFGYEGRSAFPSNFDADYCYSLGFTAFLLMANGFTGCIASIKNLAAPPENWQPGGLPLTMMMNIEKRHGKNKPVIKKALVELEGEPFKTWVKMRGNCAVKTAFKYPGAIQYFGPEEICSKPCETLILETSALKK